MILRLVERLCLLSLCSDIFLVYGQLPLSGASMPAGTPQLQSNFGALSGGIFPQVPAQPQATGFSGLGGVPGGMGGLPNSGFGALPGSTGLSGCGLGGALGSPGQAGLPTGGQLPSLNLMGGALGQGSGTPQNIQQLQAQAVQSPKVDSMCPGKQRSSSNVGTECWAMIWAAGGCKPENVPRYEEWHQTQSLEVLVGDVVQWANLPDERHQQGCYGSSGAPVNEPAPPVPPMGGLRSPGGMGQGLGGGLGAPMAQGPAAAPEVSQKIMSTLQSPDVVNVCPGVSRQATAVGEACWKLIWRHVGCLESTAPSYEDWHNAQSFEVLVADAAQWASLPSATHRTTCYGANAEL